MQIPGYKILRKIDQGGMSTVYLAVQMSVGREVALKVMSPALNADPIFSERFQREANIVGQLSHPNIVSIYDIGRYKSLNYIAMDYLPGGSISDKLRNGISGQETLRIIKQVANALDHAHSKGYIHRDIKPENILFRDDDSPIVTDFGVAKMVKAGSGMTHAGTVVGTPHYMSPEQARGKPIDGRSDIYSLGIVFYEMLTGTVPFKAEEAVAIAIKHLTAPIPKLPPHYAIYQSFLDKLLAKDPDQRYQRGSELVSAIEGLENGLSGRGNTLNATDPASMQVTTLLKALLLTTYAALTESLKSAGRWLFSWRFMPKRGLYRRPRANIYEVHAQSGTQEQERSTIVSTRVQRAAHYQQVGSRRFRTLTSSAILLLLIGTIWAAFSSALYNFDLPGEENLPQPIHNIALFSAEFLQNPNAFLQPSSTVKKTQKPETEANKKPQITPSPLPSQNTMDERSSQSNTETTFIPNSRSTRAAPPPPMHSLTIEAAPINSKVRILNIKEPYYPGIRLLPGRYHLEVSHKGYDTDQRWLSISENTQELITLRKTPVPGAEFSNALKSGGQGPEMIILPAGKFTMGSKLEANSQPTRTVRIKQPFAISQYEITFSDYLKFVKDQNQKVPDDSGWGRNTRPVINITWKNAVDYTLWLQAQTGSRYRLPTEAEWEYAARAKSQANFWWSTDKKEAPANCRRGCNSDYSGFFISKTAPVGSYQANSFGLFDSAGNVAEWVQDCYQDNFLNAPKDGSAILASNCSKRVVRGGSMRDAVSKISNHARLSQVPSEPKNNIGFRVVVDLYNSEDIRPD